MVEKPPGSCSQTGRTDATLGRNCRLGSLQGKKSVVVKAGRKRVKEGASRRHEHTAVGRQGNGSISPVSTTYLARTRVAPGGNVVMLAELHRRREEEAVVQAGRQLIQDADVWKVQHQIGQTSYLAIYSIAALLTTTI